MQETVNPPRQQTAKCTALYFAARQSPGCHRSVCVAVAETAARRKEDSPLVAANIEHCVHRLTASNDCSCIGLRCCYCCTDVGAWTADNTTSCLADRVELTLVARDAQLERCPRARPYSVYWRAHTLSLLSVSFAIERTTHKAGQHKSTRWLCRHCMIHFADTPMSHIEDATVRQTEYMLRAPHTHTSADRKKSCWS